MVNFSNLSSGSGLPIVEMPNTFATILNCGGTSPGLGNANDGVWTLTPDAGTANYDLTLYATNYSNSGVNNTIVKRNNPLSNWVINGNYTPSSGMNPLVVNRSNFNGFSQFAISSDLTLLPIELISFIAKPSSQSLINSDSTLSPIPWVKIVL